MVHLPQELIDTIIDSVFIQGPHDGQFRDLKACSVAARAFLPSSRRHIFHSLTVNDDQFERVAAFLRSSPHLAPYFRHFTLRMFPHDDYPHLAFILRSLPNIERALLNMPLSWSLHLPSAVASALYDLIGLPSLHHLMFIDLDAPSEVIMHAMSSVGELLLFHGNIGGGEQQADIAMGLSSHLHSLLVPRAVNGYYDFILKPLILESLQGLQRLEVEMAGTISPLANPQKLITAFASTLRHLTLECSSKPLYSTISRLIVSTDIIGCLSVPPLPALQSLQISWCRNIDHLAPILSNFTDFPAALPLLEIFTFFCGATSFRQSGGPKKHKIWAAVDVTFQDRTALPHLREVRSIVLDFRYCAAAAYLEANLPKCKESGILTASLAPKSSYAPYALPY